MPWWLDLVLLGSAVLLWVKGGNTPDDVWSVFQKFLSVVAVLVVLLGGASLLAVLVWQVEPLRVRVLPTCWPPSFAWALPWTSRTCLSLAAGC
jgi:hypothetical protein